MNRYQYYYNNNPVSKKEMEKELKKNCYKTTTTFMAGPFGVAMKEFDEKEFNKNMRQIERGVTVVYCPGDSFYRRKIN